MLNHTGTVHDFDIFIGGQTGVLKGISIKQKQEECIKKNLLNVKAITRNSEITALRWSSPEEEEILIGTVDQTVKIFNTEYKSFTQVMKLECGEGKIVGLSKYDDCIVTAVESGQIKVWRYDTEKEIVLDTGKPIERMRPSTEDLNIIATGGKENDLKLWDLKTKQPVFTAKNVKHDMLELRVPVWVSDMAFIPESQKVVVCTKYGQVRLYDPKTQKRPVIDIQVPDKPPFVTVAVAPRDHHVVVGSGTGKMMMYDLRKTRAPLSTYKGFMGGIRSLVCHKSEPYIVSVSLDRHLRIHNLNTTGMLHKIYLKSKLNCVIMRSDFSLAEVYSNEEKPNKSTIPATNEGDTDVQIIEDDYDEIFAKMETVEESVEKKRKTSGTPSEIQPPTNKSKKKKG